MIARLLRPLLRLARIEGDARAADRGSGALGRRVAQRHAHRQLSRALRRWGL